MSKLSAWLKKTFGVPETDLTKVKARQVEEAIRARDWAALWLLLPPEFRAWAESHLSGRGLPR